jgi:hypothetical protein
MTERELEVWVQFASAALSTEDGGVRFSPGAAAAAADAMIEEYRKRVPLGQCAECLRLAITKREDGRGVCEVHETVPCV